MRHLILETPEADLYTELSPEKKLYLHLNFKAKQWTKSVYNNMMESFASVLLELEKRGVEAVYVLLRKTDVQTIKFETRFGFEPELEYPDIGYIRMKLEV